MKDYRIVHVPNYRYYEVKNPNTLFPIDWVARYGEDRVRFELEPEYDKNGNYLGTKENVYVTMREVVGYKHIKVYNKEDDIKPKYKLRPLFNSFSYEDKLEENEENKELESE